MDAHMLCVSAGVQSGAAAGTSSGHSAGRGKEQRARRPGERQGPAGDEAAERTTVRVCQVRKPVHTRTLTTKSPEQRKLELKFGIFSIRLNGSAYVSGPYLLTYLCIKT